MQTERRRRAGEGRVPAIDDQTADAEAEPGAEVDAARVDAERRGAPRRREVVGEQRVSGGVGACLAHADTDARQGELREAACDAGERGHHAPAGEAEGDELAPIPDVGQTPERDAEDGIEDRERRAVEIAHLRVGDLQVRLDALGEDREDLAIEKIEHVDQHQHGEGVARIAFSERHRLCGDVERRPCRRRGALGRRHGVRQRHCTAPVAGVDGGAFGGAAAGGAAASTVWSASRSVSGQKTCGMWPQAGSSWKRARGRSDARRRP